MVDTVATPATNEASELRPPESVFTIDIQGIISPYQTPSLAEVIAAVEAAVPQPQVPLVFEGWGHAKGTYTIETYDPISLHNIASLRLVKLPNLPRNNPKKSKLTQNLLKT